VCVEVSNYDCGYLIVRVMVKEIVKAVPIWRYGMICVNKLCNYLFVLFNVDNDGVGIGKGVVKDIVDNMGA
jgi:hypothetical protein